MKKEKYLEPIEKTDGKEPYGSSAVWYALNTTNESGVLPARLAIIFEQLSLTGHRELLQQAHFPDTFLQEKHEYHLRGNGHDVAINIIDEALEHGYPANVLVIQLAGVETLLPFLPEFWGSQLKEYMPKLLKIEDPSIRESMNNHFNFHILPKDLP